MDTKTRVLVISSRRCEKRPLLNSDEHFMRQAMRLARKGRGFTSPNPTVGAALVRDGKIIGSGWHLRAGGPHAEIEALRDAQQGGFAVAGSTLYVTLEPCSTHGRTPPCVEAIQENGIRRVVVGTVDPNPRHAGRGLELLESQGVIVQNGVLQQACAELNKEWNHWIVAGTPFVTLKAAMSLDGKIANARGESKWITSPASRRRAMRWRQSADAILVGIRTILADDPSLTIRGMGANKPLRRVILDSQGRIPLDSKVLSDSLSELTTVVVAEGATPPPALADKAEVLFAPLCNGQLDLRWLMRHLGQRQVTHLLVEGGGEVNWSFLQARLANRVLFFYGPLVIGGSDARKAISGQGVSGAMGAIDLENVRWRRSGPDLVMEAEPCYPNDEDVYGNH